MTLLSVIIPVYNAAPYLEACVSSLRALSKQVGIAMEVVLVDDGSTDGSSELCDSLGDSVLHQPNQGVSVARNAGIGIAKGEWLWFVDADDYIEPLNLLEIQAADVMRPLDNADFVNLGFVWDENGKADSFGAYASEVPYNLWRCMFRREQVMKHHVRFTVGRKYAEDQEFIVRYLLSVRACRVAAIPQIRYHYTLRPGSAMTRPGLRQKKTFDTACVIFSMWACAIVHLHFPTWIWRETKRMLKCVYVTLKSR